MMRDMRLKVERVRLAIAAWLVGDLCMVRNATVHPEDGLVIYNGDHAARPDNVTIIRPEAAA